jgi:hypothetical protein
MPEAAIFISKSQPSAEMADPYYAVQLPPNRVISQLRISNSSQFRRINNLAKGKFTD